MALNQVTVFGASGFIGRHVVRCLAAKGLRVVAAERDAERASFLRTMGDVGQVVPVSCNVADPDQVHRLVEASDAVVNLVGLLHETPAQRFADIHGVVPGVIAAAAAQAGVKRFVHVSALAASKNSASAYARTKWQGEMAARAALPDTVILRPSLVFGAEDDFFNRFAALARLSPVLPLFGGGKTRFQPVYVCDVAGAVVAGLLRADTCGRDFDLGGPRVYSFAELMELILSVIERNRLCVPLPMGLADVIGFGGDIYARFGLKPLLTRDQAKLLRIDSIIEDALDTRGGLAELGIAPMAAEAILPGYLARFRKAGAFAPSGI